MIVMRLFQIIPTENLIKKLFLGLLCAVLFSSFVMKSACSAALKAQSTQLAPSILLIGDSHTFGSFGRKEDALLRQLTGYRVITYGVCGSSPHNWFLGLTTNCGYVFKDENALEQRSLVGENPSIAELVGQYHPDYILIALGANMYGAGAEWVKISSGELALAAVYAKSKCIWIGPPQARIQPEPAFGQLYEALSSTVTPYCEFIDSRKYTHYPDTEGDGIHFDTFGQAGVEIAESWAISVFDEIKPFIAPIKIAPVNKSKRKIPAKSLRSLDKIN